MASPAAGAKVLRVCADPNNLPFSNSARQGLENRLAEILAKDLGMQVEYSWWAEHKNFIGKSLNADQCDVLMGVPTGLDSVAFTQPYYRSTYVWVSKKRHGADLSSLYDDRLKSLRIGVHLMDDGYAPPATLLAANGLAANLVAFSLYGKDGEPNPPARLIEAVMRGEVDAALAWGPLAGYFATSNELNITAVTPNRFGPVPFVYEIAVAVRKDDSQLRDKLDRSITRQCAAIGALLKEYRFPQAGEERPLCGSSQPVSASSH